MGTSIPVAKWPSHKQLTGAKPTYQELSAGEEALPAGETAPFRVLIHRKNKNQFSKIETEVELSLWSIQISLVLAGKSTVCTAICSSSGSGAIIAAASGVAVTRMIQTWLPNIRSRLNAALISARWVKA